MATAAAFTTATAAAFAAVLVTMVMTMTATAARLHRDRGGDRARREHDREPVLLQSLHESQQLRR